MNRKAADLIAEHLPKGLVVPASEDGTRKATPIPIPGLSQLGMVPEQAAAFAAEAGLPDNDAPALIGEAIVDLLERNGLELVDRAELEALKTHAATSTEADPLAPTVTLKCSGCRNELGKIASNRAVAYAPARQLVGPCTCPA